MNQNRDTPGNRLKLLEAAAHEFSTAGYHGTSLRAIARRANVSFQLIHHHFGCKRDLWQAVVEYLFSGLVLPEKLLRFNDRSDIRTQFHDHLQRMMMSTFERSHLRKITFIEQFENSDRYTDYLKPRATDFLSSRVRPYFEQAVAKGLLPGLTADEAAVLWSGLVTQNIVDPDFVEFFIGHPVGSIKSIDRQVDLMFRVLTGTLAMSGDSYPPTAGSAGDEAESDSPDVTTATNIVYMDNFQRVSRQCQELKLENSRLKQLVGELTLENRYLTERVKSHQRSDEGRDEAG